MRCNTGFSIETFYVKQMSPLLPLFTPFGRAVRGKGTPKIASIGHSVLGNAKIRYDTGLALRFLHKYMSSVLPPFVAVRGKATLKMLTLVSTYSRKPKVRYVSDFNFGSFT